VVFTGQNSSDNKFSKVGYVSVEELDRLGFKASVMGGYTVIKRQLTVGVHTSTLTIQVKNSDGEGVIDEQGRPVPAQAGSTVQVNATVRLIAARPQLLAPCTGLAYLSTGRRLHCR